MSKILITGGAGFIGLSLAAMFQREGLEVDLVDDFSRGKNDAVLTSLLERGGVRCVQRDLSVLDASQDLDRSYDYIFHFAAVLGVERVVSRAYATLALNVQLTLEGLRLAQRQKRLAAFVLASSSEIYSGSVRARHLQFPTPEDALITLPPLDEPRSSYMLSKLYGEALVQHAGIPGVIVRPHNVYGPRMGAEHVVPELMMRIQRARPGTELTIASSDHSRTFCYIDDAVEMIRRLAFDSRAVGGVWNVGCQSPEYQIMEVAEIIRGAIGVDVHLVAAPATPGSPVRRCPSMAKTETLTGYRPRVSFELGVAETYSWYRQHPS